MIVEGELPAYYETLMNYIHLNPGRAGLVNVEKRESILDYPWSSVAGGYALPPEKRAKWLAAEMGMRVMGFADTAAGRRELVIYLARVRNSRFPMGKDPRTTSRGCDPCNNKNTTNQRSGGNTLWHPTTIQTKTSMTT